MILSTLLLIFITPCNCIQSRYLNATDDILTFNRPTRPNTIIDRPTRPNTNSDYDSNTDRPNSNTNSEYDTPSDDESYLPTDDEYYLPPSTSLFASGNSQDWGIPNNSTSIPIALDKGHVSMVAAGNLHSVMVDEGVLFSSGLAYGGLGLGRDGGGAFEPITEVYAQNSSNIDKTNFNTTKATTDPPKFTQVYASQYYTVAIDENGRVWSTGSNSYGQLCLGDDVDRERFEMVDDALFHEVLVTDLNNGTLVESNTTNASLVGSNTTNGTSFSNTTNATTTEEIGINDATPPPQGVFDDRTLSQTNPRIVNVALGERHTLLLREDGAVYACGWNQYGQLGLNSTSSVLFPTRVLVEDPVVNVTAGRGSSYFLTESNNVYVVGTNYNGQLCTDGGDKSIPTIMDPFRKDDGVDGSELNVSSITSGKSSLYMLLSDGQVLVCGENTHGQLGLGSSVTSVNVPTLISLNDVISIFSSSASYSAFFVQRNGTVYAVGYNGGGHLGVGDEMNHDTPTVVACSNVSEIDADMASKIFISTGNDHTLFLGSESTFVCDDGSGGLIENDDEVFNSTRSNSPTVSPTITGRPTLTPMPTGDTDPPTMDDNSTLDDVYRSDMPTSMSPNVAPVPNPSGDRDGSSGVMFCHHLSLVLGLACFFGLWI